MNCRHCGSQKTVKDGRDRKDRQKWLCKDCNRRTVEGADLADKGGGRKPRKWANDAERMRAKRREQGKARIIRAKKVLDEIPPKTADE